MERFRPFTLRIGGEIKEFTRPQVMGILNVTPDSFYAGSRTPDMESVERRVLEMVSEGVDIIDIGGCSTRPGFEAPEPDEEWRRVACGIETVLRIAPDMIISVDTFRGSVAKKAIEAGAHIINDISAFTLAGDLYDAVVELNVPYILMHPSLSTLTPSTPADETLPRAIADLQRIQRRLRLDGVADIIIDPGFGFGKTVNQNYQLMDRLEYFSVLEAPLLVGISRKSMIYKPLGITPADSLAGTITLNTIALTKGAAILRVHDVAPARQAVEVVEILRNSYNDTDR